LDKILKQLKKVKEKTQGKSHKAGHGNKPISQATEDHKINKN
jgi:hypothetical protein